VRVEIDAVTATSGRLAHLAEHFGPPVRRPALALTAEGPRRADLIAWASAHREVLGPLRLLAPAGIGALLAEHAGLATQPLRAGTVGPAATAGLVAAGDIDAMVAFTDPIELRPGDTTTRSLIRLAIFWDIPIASNRATADLLLAALTLSPPPVSPSPPSPRPLSPPPPSPRPPSPVSSSAPPTAAPGAVRLWTVRATVDDVPGRLAILAASLARRAINILSVQVHLSAEGPIDELLVAASPILDAGDLTAAVVDGGGRAPHVTAADAHALVDSPTRALTLATRLIRTPADLPAALRILFPGADLTWRPEPPPGQEDEDGRALWLVDPTGGGFLLGRPGAPFTPAECARAYAMVDVATVALGARAQAEPERVRAMLADGGEVEIRRANGDDLAAIVDLHVRCSLTSRLRRYLAGTTCPPEPTLRRMLTPEAGQTLVAEDPDGRIVAMANLMWNDERPELALLVEDAWQGRRLGTLLARRLGQAAERSGARTVTAVVHAGNTPMVRIMTGLGHRMHREYDEGRLFLIATLRPDRGQTQRLPSSIRWIQSR
jgi:methylglyoxal synthase